MHDVAEYYTGDVPYTAKRDNPQLKEELMDMEVAYENQYGIPDAVLSPEELTLFKLADMLDLVLSCQEEVIMGNRYAVEILQNGLAFINAMDISEELSAKVKAIIHEGDRAWVPQTRDK